MLVDWGHLSLSPNAQLLEPVLQRLAGPWETIFSRRLPGVLALLPNSAGHILTAFHNDQEKRAIRNGGAIAAFQMLRQQIAVYRETLRDAMGETRGQITEKQRDANRELEPRLTVDMLDAYAICTAEAGPGQYARMKAHMLNHVDQEKHTMFDNSINHVERLIKALLREVKEQLLERVDGIYLSMEREYTSAVLGQETNSNGAVLPREQRAMRKNVLDIVDGSEMTFKRAVGLEPELEEDFASEEVVESTTIEAGQADQSANAGPLGIASDQAMQISNDSDVSAAPLSNVHDSGTAAPGDTTAGAPTAEVDVEGASTDTIAIQAHAPTDQPVESTPQPTALDVDMVDI